jgi:hypothetical protein
VPTTDPARARDILDTVCAGGILADDDMSVLLRTYARLGINIEDDRLELKEDFQPDKTGWANLCRQAVALHNTGGGVLIFGVEDDGTRRGLSSSLAGLLDPANVNNQLTSRRAPAVLRTTYTELRRYNKTFGFFAVRGGTQIVVFDQNAAGTDGKIICLSGCVYVRRNGQSAPAQYFELQTMTERIVTRGVQGFLARVDRIATLPASANLIAANPGSADGFILTARGEGVPVHIIGPEQGAPTVTLSEEVLPDTPLSEPFLEVAGQVRQWRTDSNHRVPSAVINRWYRERGSINFSAINGDAEFLLLSTLHENAFPVHYWASLMDLDRLREVLVELIASDPYPERVTVPYVVGAFLWEERATVLAPHASKAGSYAGYGRVVRAMDRDGFLLGGRSAPENFELPSGATARITADVLSDVLVAGAVFDECLHAGDDYVRRHRPHMQQLDLWLHGSRA